MRSIIQTLSSSCTLAIWVLKLINRADKSHILVFLYARYMGIETIILFSHSLNLLQFLYARYMGIETRISLMIKV